MKVGKGALYEACYGRFADDDDEEVALLAKVIELFEENKRKPNIRNEAYSYKREDWNEHLKMLRHTNQFRSRYRMEEETFNSLLDMLSQDITVNFARSMACTQGNEPIYPEIVLGTGIRFLAGELPRSLADIYGYSTSHSHKIIQYFLDAVMAAPALELKLPFTDEEIEKCREEWNKLSTADGIFYGFIGAIDGWLVCTSMPSRVDNQADYFSGHYQRYGLNVQAICDANLRFLYFTVAAPGKCNDLRAFGRLEKLLRYLDELPEGIFLGGDNAYPMSSHLIIPFSGAERSVPDKRAYNYYLSQLRIRIEMAFGRLTTKWRIFRRNLDYAVKKNAQICQVASRLHNFIIEQEKINIDVDADATAEDIRTAAQIDPLAEGPANNMGYLPNPPPRARGPEDGAFRSSILENLIKKGLRRPDHNIDRNQDEEVSVYDEGEDEDM